MHLEFSSMGTVPQAPEVILQQHANGTKPSASTLGPPNLSRYGPNLATPVSAFPPMSRMRDTSQITIESVRKRLQER